MEPAGITRPATSHHATPSGSAVSAHAEFRRFAGRSLDRAYRLAGLLLGGAGEAEDAVQDALLRAWRAAGDVQHPAQLEAWFDRILVNVCRDRMRRRRIITFVPLDGTVEPAIERDPFKAVIDGDLLLGGVRRLGPDERIVIVLHYWADLRLEDIAARLGWPVGTVKSRLHRALGVLRRELGVTTEAEG